MGHSALHLIEQHGYAGLYISLALGILGIPVPDETLMTFTGFLIYRRELSYLPAVLASVGGSLTGMSLSYWIGRLAGIPFIHRYGKYIHITPERFENGRKLVHRYGGKAIIFGYFVPGFRHLTAYASGISKLTFPRFLGMAAIGAWAWTLSFITLGRFIGKDWALIGRLARRYIGLTVLASLVILLIVAWVQNEKRRRKNR